MTQYAKRAEIALLLGAIHHIRPFDAAWLVARESDETLDQWLTELQFEYLAQAGRQWTATA